MQKKKIAYIIGTRPEIIRSARIISALKNDGEVDCLLVHTGQHYDHSMSEGFFSELNIPMPDINLHVGSGSHGEQTAKMIDGLEKYFVEKKPDIVTIFGDTNSSLAAAIAALKLHIPIAHIESGCREWDMSLPEETNRRMIDHCSNLLLAVSDVSVKNLHDEKVLGAVYNTGDPLFDVFKTGFEKSQGLHLREELGLEAGSYIFLTVHRAGNVDNLENLRHILDALTSVSHYRIVLPIHPHTKKQLEQLKYPKEKLAQFVIVDPLQHQEVLHLVSQAKMVVTDSGGLQKEVFWSHVPCITLRDITAWSETVDLGVNFLTGTDEKKIVDTIHFIEQNYEAIQEKFKHIEDPYYKKDTVENTVRLLKEYCNKGW